MNGKTKFYKIEDRWGLSIWESTPELLHLSTSDGALEESDITKLIEQLQDARELIKAHRIAREGEG